MSSTNPSSSAQELSDHVEFMSALSRRLVFDEHTAEDLVQDAQVAALEGTAHASMPLRAWLGGVLRHLSIDTHRRDQRRRHHEQRVSSPRSAPGTDEVAERLESQRVLAGLVEALEEPYRRALYLRYYENMPPREIAQLQELPLATVKTHLRRGLETLRTRLDAAHDGQRENWCALLALPVSQTKLAPPGASGSVGVTALGGSFMVSKLVLVLAGGLLALGWYINAGSQPEAAGPQGGLAVTASGTLPDQLPAEDSELQQALTEHRAPLERGTAEQGVATLAPALPTWIVFGRVSTGQGESVANTSVRVGYSLGEPTTVECDGEGEYRAELPFPKFLSPHARVGINAQAQCAGHVGQRLQAPAEVLAHFARTTASPTQLGEIEMDLRLEPVAVVRGRLIHRGGRPAQGVRVALRDASNRVQDYMESDEQGRFGLPCPTPGNYTFIAGNRLHGFAERAALQIELGQGLDIGDLPLGGAELLRGSVSFSDGTPVKHEPFLIMRDTSEGTEPLVLPTGWDEGSTAILSSGKTNALGEFELSGFEYCAYKIHFHRLRAASIGFSREASRSGPHHSSEFARVVLDLQVLRATVVDLEGLPVPGARLSVSKDKMLSAAGSEGLEGVAVFAVGPGLHQVSASVPGAAAVTREVEVLAGSHLTEVVIALDFAPVLGHLRLEVHDESGTPVKDWKLGLFRPGERLVAFDSLVPDGEGLIEGIPVGAYSARVLPGNEGDTAFFDQTVQVQVVEGETAQATVQLKAGGRLQLDLVGPADGSGAGTPVTIIGTPADGRSPRKIHYLYRPAEPDKPMNSTPGLGLSGRTDLLRTGAYEFTFTAEGYQPVTIPLRILPHASLKTRVEFTATGDE